MRMTEESEVVANVAKSKVGGRGEPRQGTPLLIRENCSVGLVVATGNEGGTTVLAPTITTAALTRAPAEAGNAAAQRNLAGLLVHGHCMKQDFVGAYTWLLIAGRKSGKLLEAVSGRLTAEQRERAESDANAWVARHRVRRVAAAGK